MATELFSLWGYLGWSTRASGTTKIVADFDGKGWSFEHADNRTAEREFGRAARHARLKWLWSRVVGRRSGREARR